MLNPNAQKLIDALRSGEYKQTKGQLRNGDTFCCLGVACNIAAEDVGGGWDGVYFDTGGDRSKCNLPDPMREWLGFSGVGGGYTIDGTMRWLTDDNDVHGKTFEEIADIIESEPKGLFA